MGMPSTPAVQIAGPDHRDLYLIVIGILAGILLGPYVLGRVKPEVYRRAFVGGVEEARLVRERDRQIEAIEKRGMAGASDVALLEKVGDLRKQQAPLIANYEKAIRERSDRLARLTTALVLAIVALMVIETLVDPARPDLRARLATARYAVVAAWLALLFARPELLKSLPMLFLGGVIVVAIAAALVPLRARR
jgi:hypothetical protein